MGIRAMVDGKRVLCGNAELLKQQGIAVEEVQEAGTVVYAAVDDRFVGFIVIADTLKPGAREAVQQLKAETQHIKQFYHFGVKCLTLKKLETIRFMVTIS